MCIPLLPVFLGSEAKKLPFQATSRLSPVKEPYSKLIRGGSEDPEHAGFWMFSVPQSRGKATLPCIFREGVHKGNRTLKHMS